MRPQVMIGAMGVLSFYLPWLPPEATSSPGRWIQTRIQPWKPSDGHHIPALDRAELSDPSMVSGKEKGWDPFGKGPWRPRRNF
jgi:hypothetical protein